MLHFLLMRSLIHCLASLEGVIALLGVVAAPITSGDTAFRSARLIVADFLKFKQGPIKNRLLYQHSAFHYWLPAYQDRLQHYLALFCMVESNSCDGCSLGYNSLPVADRQIFLGNPDTGVVHDSCHNTYLLFAPEGFSLPGKSLILQE